MPLSGVPSRPYPRAALGLAALALGLHLLPRPGYGFHRDELLYLAMADHLDLFRMQFPPLIALLGRLAHFLPLDLLAGIHLLSGLAGAAIILIGVAIARALGAGAEGEWLSGLALLLAPLMVRGGSLFQPVIFEMLWWAIGILAFTKLLAGDHRRWWLVMGLMAGLGGLTKFSAAIFGGAMAVGVVLSPLRNDFRTRWPWVAVLLGGVLACPSVLGQIHWQWPFLAQARVLRATQLQRVTSADFLSGQLLMAGAASPLLLVGFVGLLRSNAFKPYRGLGVMALLSLVALIGLHGKEYYFGPMHPLLLAAGGTLAGQYLRRRRALYLVLAAAIGLGGLVLLPVGIPLLPPERMARYTSALGLTRVVTTNRGTLLPLPQDYADMLGWREQVAAVAEVYHALPDSEQARAVIVAGNYGRAGALAVYHQEFGLPYPISRSGDFYHWGPGGTEPAAIIIVGGTVEELQTIFGSVTEVRRVENPLGVEEEQEVRIHLCRKPRQPFMELWRALGPDWG
jgi:hypothetical protein